MRHFWLTLLVVLALVSGASVVRAQEVELSVQSRQIYADVPFVLQVSVSGFAEAPEPKIRDFAIPGAKVAYLGMSPSTMSMRQVINGQVTEMREVRFVYSYRVEVPRAGSYDIPEIVVEQGGASAKSPPKRFSAQGIADTREMSIEMRVPERPVWIGESFEVEIDWYLRLNPRDQSFVVPLFDHPAFDVEAPENAAGDLLKFSAGDREIALPYESSEASIDGVDYTRFRFRAVATPSTAGTFELEAPRVVAKLQTGMGRDAFGFRSPRSELFKSAGKPVSMIIKPLPMSNRPRSFANAVGAGFSIEVQSSRSVVSVGEPIELTVIVRGKRGLDGLSLPALIGEGGLPAEQFELIGDHNVGEVLEDGSGKQFKVTVQLKSTDAREIPALDFSYFDPEAADYKTVKSQPIALNVAGAAMVSAKDVVGGARDRDRTGSGLRQAFGGDLSPSDPDETLSMPLATASVRPFLWVLYLLPLVVLLVRIWMTRTRDKRGLRSDLKAALVRVEDAASAASRQPARESVSPLLTALRELARSANVQVGELEQKLEDLAYDPQKNGEPVPADLIHSCRDLARSWIGQAPQKSLPRATTVATFLVGLILTVAAPARAATPDRGKLELARQTYAQALSIEDRAERKRAFAQAEALYAELCAQLPGRPELLTDWGHAALGSGNVGQAALAYRRALAIDAGVERASLNLQWIREQLPAHLQPKQESSAVDSLFFWHRGLSPAAKHLWAAVAFALCILLVTPWGRHSRILRRFAVLPGVICAVLLSSVVLTGKADDHAVVVSEGGMVRSADSAGAPAAMSLPLPPGTELRVVEDRSDWARVVLADGSKGWLQSRYLEHVRPQ